jgi:serine/threonine protein kinase
MKIGRYRVIRELACGGMAKVFLGAAPSGRQVVIKRPLREDAEAFDRLLDEAQAGARLEHPYIVETLDFFTDEEDVPHLVLGYVEGRTLLQAREDGPLDPDVVLMIGRQMCEALDVMHRATDNEGDALGMVHRDISPSNIVLGTDGAAHLIDLGIVRSTEAVSSKTRAGFLRGKIGYLAPELFFGQSYSPASDLWALGLVLFEAALGRRAITGSQPEMTARIVGGHVMTLKEGEALEPRLHQALMQLVHPNPELRVNRARDAVALFRMLEHGSADDVVERAAAAALGRLGPTTVVGTLLEESEEIVSLNTADFAALDDLAEEEAFDDADLEATGPITRWDRPAPLSLSSAIHGMPTDLLGEGGSTTSLIPVDEPPNTVQERLSHYIAELQSLTHPAEAGPPMFPPPSDPWQMDSSPGR